MQTTQAQAAANPGFPLALGLIAGVRSATAPATLSLALAQNAPSDADNQIVALAIRLRPLLLALAGAELISDKLPGMPDRTSPPVLLGRIALGALAGGLAARASGRSALLAGLLAGSAALAASFASFHLRRLASERLGLPSPAVGLLEDVALLTAVALLVRQAPR